LAFFAPKASEFPTITYAFETWGIAFAGLNHAYQIFFIKTSDVLYAQLLCLLSDYF